MGGEGAWNAPSVGLPGARRKRLGTRSGAAESAIGKGERGDSIVLLIARPLTSSLDTTGVAHAPGSCSPPTPRPDWTRARRVRRGHQSPLEQLLWRRRHPEQEVRV